MKRARTHFFVIGLQQNTPLAGPELLQRQDDVLKGKGHDDGKIL
jgi:hypothetical protein